MDYDLTRRNKEGRVLYQSEPYAYSHPDRLATIATLYGMQPAQPDNCRLLELGCADGANIIPMAESFPHSEFVGIDRSESEIDSGRELIQKLGLSNVRLEPIDFLDIQDSLDKFDYVISHGVFSWVPRDVQDKILSIYAQHLDRSGVAFINLSTYPSGYVESVVRDMLRLNSMRYDDPIQRAAEARKMLKFMGTNLSKRRSPYGQLLATHLGYLMSQSDGYLYHGFLDVQNNPIYFRDFVDRLEAEGLQYLADSEQGTRWMPPFPERVESEMKQLVGSQIEREQIVDFLLNRTVRNSLMCHSSIELQDALSPQRLETLFISAEVQHDPPLPGLESIVYRFPHGRTLNTSLPGVKAALNVLGENWPRRITFEDLTKQVSERTSGITDQDWAERLCECYANGTVQLSTCPERFTFQIDDRPRATPLVRKQAAMGNAIANLDHSLVGISDVDRRILQRLDGEHDHAEIVAMLSELIARNEMALPDGEASEQSLLDHSLSRLASKRLLCRNE